MPSQGCAPGLPAYVGPLCGPPNMPCASVIDEVLLGAPVFRNDAPSVALDDTCLPYVLYSTAQGAFQGFLAHRDATGLWTAQQTPFPVSTGGLALSPAGDVHALADNGSSNVTLWTQSGGQWNGGAPALGTVHAGSGSLARDGAGLLHAGLGGPNNTAFHGTYGAAWQLTPLGTVYFPRVAVAVSAAGQAQLAYWTANANWKLTWAAPPAAPEDACLLGSNILDFQQYHHAIAIGLPDGPNPAGRPHLLSARPLPGLIYPNEQEIIYSTRQGPGQWNNVVVEQVNLVGNMQCDYPATMPGQTCDYDYEDLWPIGIVATLGKDVRFVYAKLHFMGTWVADCMFGNCEWASQSNLTTGDLRIGWLDSNGQAQHAVVANGVLAQGGTVALDGLGRIHVAIYDMSAPTFDGLDVRYFRIGP